MAKKHLGSLIAIAAVVGATAAGISYFLRYKSFHKELEEDFHDFEDEEDEFDDLDLNEDSSQTKRTYVPLNTEKGENGKQEDAEGTDTPVAEGEALEKTDGEVLEDGTAKPSDETAQKPAEASTTIIEEEDSAQ